MTPVEKIKGKKQYSYEMACLFRQSLWARVLNSYVNSKIVTEAFGR